MWSTSWINAGSDAVVLFNRFLQPDIDLKTESLKQEMVFSSNDEMKLPLRWVALLHGRVKTDLALNTGVHSGLDAAKAMLAGRPDCPGGFSAA